MRDTRIEGYRRHDNRHTYASHLVSGGLSLEVVGRLLGHTSPETTKRYAHLADDPLRRATEMFSAKIDESRDRCSAASHVAAILADKSFHALKAPVKRITVPDTAMPYAPSAELPLLPNADRIRHAAKTLMDERR